MPLFGPSDGALRLVYLQAQSPFDERLDARHHSLPSSLATHVDVRVVRVANETVPTTRKLLVELIQHDVAQQWRERTALRHPFLRAHNDAVRQHHLRLQHLSDQYEQPLVVHSLREPRHEPLVVDSIEEFLQIDVDYPLVPFVQILNRFGDGRLAATTRTKPVATRMKRRLIHRFEHLTYRLLHHAISHV